MRPGYHEFAGLDPEKGAGSRRTYYISIRQLHEHLYKHRRLKALNVEAAVKVLENPSRVYRGIRPETRERWGYCFVGRPEEWHVADGVVAPLPKRLLYCVFVGDRDIVYEWRAERARDVEKGLVEEAEARFEEVIWMRTEKP